LRSRIASGDATFGVPPPAAEGGFYGAKMRAEACGDREQRASLGETSARAARWAAICRNIVAANIRARPPPPLGRARGLPRQSDIFAAKLQNHEPQASARASQIAATVSLNIPADN